MALVLNIETATTNCSVSLSKDGETLVLKEDNSLGYSHAETLHLFIDEVFKEANLEPSQIDAVAVSKGPGSYTGLRIGVSSAKGLCFALDKPLIALSTLESLAHQVKAESGFIVPM
ncbi:MAG: tRNA (adenosine(37)-N6)-threonylcarbamoyltransferase complex dimerization subunit type 1 TsaB, partial [Winogradskyella arenosi]